MKKTREWQKNINLFPNKPWFLRVCNATLLKTLWEEEKFACNASTYLENFLPFSSNVKLPSANSFSLEESKI